ncbi:heterokaryon incompatibility protein-domain-containing protein [Boeremia exigua]|uniref:heterokaryon incompatibility protein-domain-containing protein n=1 Tax=Boeremia exigua TaxID=749465 RepID=UPI001E8E7392|nr:heterokaryon incompatibility protein-domain-containing protein [Boeremia exigua]KAH6638799.1 heterokaryon incompatibility protein-domain-containing protein [Boeremia exigua]
MSALQQRKPTARWLQKTEEYFALMRMSPHVLLNSSSKRDAFTRLWKFSSQTASYRALCIITCQYCSPLMERAYFEIEDLKKGCSFCEIVRQTSRHFSVKEIRSGISVNYGYPGIAVILEWLECNFFIRVQVHSKEPHNPHNPFPPPKNNISLDPGSVSAVDVVQGWFADCEKRHDLCAAYTREKRSLPSRILQIVGEDEIRLISPSELIKYTALTYCWGGSRQPITTTENYASRCHNFSFHDFPQTLKDAISFTRALGINYIWIDCLCIVQDDNEDWAAEAARLADIYSGAFVVLAATRSSDAAEGFLQQREKPLEISISNGQRRKLEVQVRRTSNHKWWDGGLDLRNLPLFQRGWCLQERLLACRIVHFLPDEILYECKEAVRCECDLRHEMSKSKDWWVDTEGMLWPPISIQNSDDYNDVYTFWLRWKQLAYEFSRLNLTYADDALPALSGFASRSLSLHPGRYIAGVWEKGIAFHLSWYRQTAIPSTDDAGQSRTASVPTFSWLYHLNQVMYPVILSNSRPICTYLDGGSTLTTSDPFGRVSDAFIQLKGHSINGLDLIKYLNNDEDHGLAEEAVLLRTPISIKIDASPHEYWSDDVFYPRTALIKELDWCTVRGFGLLHYTFSGDEVVILLLLSPASDGSSFVRVGLVGQCPKLIFDKYAAECTVTIV